MNIVIRTTFLTLTTSSMCIYENVITYQIFFCVCFFFFFPSHWHEYHSCWKHDLKWNSTETSVKVSQNSCIFLRCYRLEGETIVADCTSNLTRIGACNTHFMYVFRLHKHSLIFTPWFCQLRYQIHCRDNSMNISWHFAQSRIKHLINVISYVCLIMMHC